MTPEVRRKALATAAKTAMVMTLGCAPSPPPAGPTATAAPKGETPAKAEAPASSCDAYLAGLAVVTPDKLASNDPLLDTAHKGREVYEAFADVAARSNPRTQECCKEALTRDGAQAKPRFACCSALGPGQPTRIAGACVPWGPPWPPEMA